MQSFSKNKFIATILTVSFVGTSLFAPFSAKGDLIENLNKTFSDPKVQKDAAGILVSCVLAAYLPDAIDAVAAGAGEVATALGMKASAGTKEASAEGTGEVSGGQTEAKTAVSAAEASAASSVPIVSVPVTEAVSALSLSLKGLQTSNKDVSGKSEEEKSKSKGQDTITDCLVYGAGQLLLKQLTNNIVTWVKGGFHGSPSFAVDTHEVFLDLADMVAGDLAREIRGISMCKFSATFQNDLANNIELSAKHIYKFNGATKCPFPETINVNSSDFYKQANNFTWAGMEYAMQYAGNPFGVALLSGRELSLRSSEKADVRKQELSWSNGFTNMVDTDNCDYPEGYTIDADEKGKYNTNNNTTIVESANYVGSLIEKETSAQTEVDQAQASLASLQKEGGYLSEELRKSTSSREKDRISAQITANNQKISSAQKVLATAQAKLKQAQTDANAAQANFNEQGATIGDSQYDQTLSPKEVRELQKTHCKTTTPGKIVGDQLTKALGVDADRLGLVDSLNKIIAAVIERLTQDATMGVFKAVSGQSEAKVQQNYITTQDKTAETISMENYAIKSAKDELATAQGNLAIALKDSTVPQETIYALRQMVSDAQKRVDDVTSPERAIARQTELNEAHTEVDNALSAERSAQAIADSASTAYYTALNGSLDGGTYIQPDPTTLASLKSVWDNADNALVKAQGVTANAKQRLYDAQHP